MATLNRLVPYKNYKFQVKWDGKVVAGVSKVGGLTRTTEVVKWRAGGDPSTPHVSPGQSEYSPVHLEEGLTADLEFEQWANKVWDYKNSGQNGSEVSLKDFRKDITINLMNEAGQVVMAWNVYKCWPSECTSMPELDASANAVGIRSLTLQNEGFELDSGTTAPAEPSFVDPSS